MLSIWLFRLCRCTSNVLSSSRESPPKDMHCSSSIPIPLSRPSKEDTCGTLSRARIRDWARGWARIGVGIVSCVHAHTAILEQIWGAGLVFIVMFNTVLTILGYGAYWDSTGICTRVFQLSTSPKTITVCVGGRHDLGIRVRDSNFEQSKGE